MKLRLLKYLVIMSVYVLIAQKKNLVAGATTTLNLAVAMERDMKNQRNAWVADQVQAKLKKT